MIRIRHLYPGLSQVSLRVLTFQGRDPAKDTSGVGVSPHTHIRSDQELSGKLLGRLEGGSVSVSRMRVIRMISIGSEVSLRNMSKVPPATPLIVLTRLPCSATQ